MSNKNVGRPIETNPRNVLVKFKVTKDENKRILDLCEKINKNRSDLMRNLVLGNIDEAEFFTYIGLIPFLQKFKKQTTIEQEKAKDDLKQGDGGLIDIEFITQYGVLKDANKQLGLLEWTDNIRLLESLAKYKCFGEIDISPLADAYRQFRSALHRKSLADDSYQGNLSDYAELRYSVIAIWKQVFELA